MNFSWRITYVMCVMHGTEKYCIAVQCGEHVDSEKEFYVQDFDMQAYILP